MSNPTENGNGVTKHRVVVVTLTYDLETFLLTIGGACPTPELVKVLCLMGADEADTQMRARRAAHALRIATPEFLASLKGG